MDVFSTDSLHDGGLPGVVQALDGYSSPMRGTVSSMGRYQDKDPELLLLLLDLLQDGEQTHVSHVKYCR